MIKRQPFNQVNPIIIAIRTKDEEDFFINH